MKDILNESDRHYISLLQENINRMATNSANCKTWLVTLVAAILALQLTSKELQSILWVALGLIVLFYILDSYYLGLERRFIAVEKDFVKAAKEKEKDEMTKNIYSFDIDAIKDNDATICSAMGSPSTWLFYGVLFFIVLTICLWPCISKLWSL